MRYLDNDEMKLLISDIKTVIDSERPRLSSDELPFVRKIQIVYETVEPSSNVNTTLKLELKKANDTYVQLNIPLIDNVAKEGVFYKVGLIVRDFIDNYMMKGDD